MGDVQIRQRTSSARVIYWLGRQSHVALRTVETIGHTLTFSFTSTTATRCTDIINNTPDWDKRNEIVPLRLECGAGAGVLRLDRAKIRIVGLPWIRSMLHFPPPLVCLLPCTYTMPSRGAGVALKKVL